MWSFFNKNESNQEQKKTEHQPNLPNKKEEHSKEKIVQPSQKEITIKKPTIVHKPRW